MLKTLIVDDEAPARQFLAEHLGQESQIEIVGQASSGREALEMISKLQPDVIFLDIQMPGLNGLDVARELAGREAVPRVVFVTAFEEHAIKAFELEAVDYLLKPVEPSRLKATLKRLERDSMQRPNLQRLLGLLEQKEPEPPLTRLALLDEVAQVRFVVSLNDICYITSKDDKTYVHLEERALRSMDSLGVLEKRLPGDQFLRSHRAYLINLHRVLKISPWSSGTYNLTLRGVKEPLPLSRGQAPIFKAKLGW